MNLPQGIILLDSLGDLQPENTSPVLVCGSHCGGNRYLAMHVKNCHVKAVFLNNAGVGKNQAGTRGLKHYEKVGVLACAVDHNSAEIGISKDTLEFGIISHVNKLAEELGIQIGQSVQKAVAQISSTIEKISIPLQNESPITESGIEVKESKADLKKQTQTQVYGVNITVTDSITFLNENNAGDIVICGSHGGVSAGHYAQKRKVKAVFFNDAGIGKNNAGVKSLVSLSDSGVIACTIDCMSAEIFNGYDALKNGIISVCNPLATKKGIKESMTVTEALKYI